MTKTETVIEELDGAVLAARETVGYAHRAFVALRGARKPLIEELPALAQFGIMAVKLVREEWKASR